MINKYFQVNLTIFLISLTSFNSAQAMELENNNCSLVLKKSDRKMDSDKLNVQISEFKAKIKNSTLDLSSYNIEDEDLEALNATLIDNQNIKSLDLSSNNIKDKGIKALSEMLKENDSLVWIYLESNKFGEEGLKSFNYKFNREKKIRYIKFFENINDMISLSYTTLIDLHIFMHNNKIESDFIDNKRGLLKTYMAKYNVNKLNKCYYKILLDLSLSNKKSHHKLLSFNIKVIHDDLLEILYYLLKNNKINKLYIIDFLKSVLMAKEILDAIKGFDSDFKLLDEDECRISLESFNNLSDFQNKLQTKKIIVIEITIKHENHKISYNQSM
jgi:hypothetical protein